MRSLCYKVLLGGWLDFGDYSALVGDNQDRKVGDAIEVVHGVLKGACDVRVAVAVKFDCKVLLLFVHFAVAA